MEVYVLEVYDQRERIASLDGDGNWECPDYQKLAEVVKATMPEVVKQFGAGVNKYTGCLLQRQDDS